MNRVLEDVVSVCESAQVRLKIRMAVSKKYGHKNAAERANIKQNYTCGDTVFYYKTSLSLLMIGWKIERCSLARTNP
jgi:hypothetical protein